MGSAGGPTSMPRRTQRELDIVGSCATKGLLSGGRWTQRLIPDTSFAPAGTYDLTIHYDRVYQPIDKLCNGHNELLSRRRPAAERKPPPEARRSRHDQFPPPFLGIASGRHITLGPSALQHSTSFDG